jgi:1,4-dihydroxy-2-naphthoyl-CoA synthase
MCRLDPKTGRAFVDRFLNAILAIRRIPKPVIAAVKGICIGGGNEIAIVCDLTIATEDSRFGQAGPKVGSVPIISGTQLLPRILGEKRAREIVFLCQQYTAQEAYDMGMINKVVPRAGFDTAVRSWCATILSLSPQALRLAKVSFNFEADQLYASFLHGTELLVATYGTAECKEGMRAFLEKRKPDFAQFRK